MPFAQVRMPETQSRHRARTEVLDKDVSPLQQPVQDLLSMTGS